MLLFYQFVDGGQFQFEGGGSGQEFWIGFGLYCYQQVVVGLGIIQQVFLGFVEWVDFVVVVFDIMFGVVWYVVFSQVIRYVWQVGYQCVLDVCVYVVVFVYFYQMVQQVEVGYIGYCGYVCQFVEVVVGLVELVYLVVCCVDIFRVQFVFFFCSGEDVDVQWFGEVEQIVGVGGVVVFYVVFFDYVGYGQVEDGFWGIDGVVFGQWDVGCIVGGVVIVYDFVCYFWWQYVDWLVEDGDGYEWIVVYGVDVVDGIGGGDVVEVEGIIDDGYEEIGG